MKKILLLSASSLLSLCCFAQNPLGADSMEVNSMQIKVFADGGIGPVTAWDDSTYKPLMYAQNLWLGGIDPSNQLVVSAQTYRQSRVDFTPGPISQNAPNPAYNRVFHVKLSTISDFVTGRTSGIPSSIADWPAHGDTTLGEAYHLAPFVDVDQDGNYIPANGDYPKIKGDEAIFAIFNDKPTPADTGFGVEIHAMVYAYNDPGTPFDSTFFIEYTLHNRSANNYVDMYLSSFNDFDGGNSNDDIMGTNVSANAVFTYNADADDSGPQGFGTRIPAVGLRLLKGPPADYFDGIDNDKDGCVDGIRDANGNCIPEDPNQKIRETYLLSNSMYYNRQGSAGGLPGATTDPDNNLEYYHYLKSLWKNGFDLIVENPSGLVNTGNGDGYVASNTGTKSSFMYPGNTFDSSGAFQPTSPVNWFESPSNSSDKRSLASAGPFSLTAGQSFDLAYAVTWCRGSQPASVYENINNNLSKLGGAYLTQPVRNVGITSYSYRANYRLYFEDQWVLYNQENESLRFKLFSSSGKLVKSFSVGPSTFEAVPLESASKGIYILVEQGSGRSHKLVK